LTAFVHLRWVLPDMRGEGLAVPAEAALGAARQTWPDLTAVPLGAWAEVGDGSAALMSALDLVAAHRSHGHGFAFAIGIGLGRLGTSEALRTARLSGVALPAEILLTPIFVANTAAPPGIGWFRAPSFQESLAGFLCHRAADYRD
jgi:hypothetical protein